MGTELPDQTRYLVLLGTVAVLIGYSRVKRRLPFAHGKAVDGWVEITPTIGQWLFPIFMIPFGILFLLLGPPFFFIEGQPTALFASAMGLLMAGMGIVQARSVVAIRGRRVRYQIADETRISYRPKGSAQRVVCQMESLDEAHQSIFGYDRLRFGTDWLLIDQDAGGYSWLRYRLFAPQTD